MGEQRGEVAVERARRPAALHVTENRDPSVLAEFLFQQCLDLVGGDRVAVSVMGALGDDDHALPTADDPALFDVPAHLLCPVVGRGLLRNHQPVGRGGQGGHQREVAAMPSHHLNDERALVAGRGAAQGIHRLDDPMQGGIGADRHVGARHVVIDGSDQTNQTQEGVRCGDGR